MQYLLCMNPFLKLSEQAGHCEFLWLMTMRMPAQMLALSLEALGHQVFIEHSSKCALERAKLEEPDVFILDIGLPEMDGNELARRLKIENETSRALLIAVSGYGQEQDRLNAITAGFDQYLVKPVDASKLAELLEQHRG